jgi:hypothetical protein
MKHPFTQTARVAGAILRLHEQQRSESIMKRIFEEVAQGARDRRRFLQKLGMAGAGAVAAMPVVFAQTTAPAITDVDVLQFALNLEYLEAEFYTYATTGAGIDQQGSGSIAVTGSGTAGATTGGASPFLFNSPIKAAAQELAFDEQAHVRLLRAAITAMGGTPVAKPAINLAALGFGFGGEREFLIVARILEDIGVTAYAGAAPLLQDKSLLQYAAQILATEAEHAGAIRVMISQIFLNTTALDGADILPPPSGKSLFSVDANALVKTRTPGQVLYLAYGNAGNAGAGGFFPRGVNGAIKTSSTSA